MNGPVQVKCEQLPPKQLSVPVRPGVVAIAPDRPWVRESPKRYITGEKVLDLVKDEKRRDDEA